ncbi:MAG: hypothetical protein AAGB18_00735 [Pseudomonadota bacterium]
MTVRIVGVTPACASPGEYAARTQRRDARISGTVLILVLLFFMATMAAIVPLGFGRARK